MIGSRATSVILGAFAAVSASCTSTNGSGTASTSPLQGSEGGLLFGNGVLSTLAADCDGASRADGAREASGADASGSDSGTLCTASRAVSFARDVKPIFSQCSGEVCHTTTWGSGDPRPFLVGVPATECCDGRSRVAPGDPAESYVIQKLTGRHLCRGVQMPPDARISDADIQALSDWICLGARND